MKHAGDYSDEIAYNWNTWAYDKRKIKIDCPHCNRGFAALCSKNTKQVDTGWRWVGCDHREPYATFETTCGKCKKELMFTVYTPQ